MTPVRPRRLAVVLPTWLGDCVMATPLLRALRAGLDGCEIVAVVGKGVAPILNGLPSIDEIVPVADKRSIPAAARLLKATSPDAVLLLPNAFRWAAVARLAGIPTRIGYARDGRSWLLTHPVAAPRVGTWPRRKHAIIPAVRHYLGLLKPFDLPENGRLLELAVTPDDQAAADRVAASAGLKPDDRVAVFVPGGRYGSAKLWPAEHFASLADKLATGGYRVAVSTAPGEKRVAATVAQQARAEVVVLADHGLTLSALKAMIGRASVVVTNDTGTRHVAVALGTSTVTLFGPTDPKRTTLNAPREVELFVDVPCRPCQLKRCPLPEPQTQRCLRELSPDAVASAVAQLKRP